MSIPLKQFMLKVNTLTLISTDYPEILRNIPVAPKKLFYIGNLSALLELPRLAVVGSRKVTPYGRAVTNKLTREAAEQGIVIVSGLALGVDGLAHEAALEAGGKTIAVLPSGLDRIYPASHHNLAKRILDQGGALVTEYPERTEPFKSNFLQRNRIISGLSDGILIPEAAARSGSLNTANHALEQGRTVMAVPGNITSLLSSGTNNLIKAGAIPVTELSDILTALGLDQRQTQLDVLGSTEEETTILQLIAHGTSDASELLIISKLAPATFNQTLTMLEITGKIRPIGAGHWALQ
jgi:DNA processing protein